MVIVRCIAVVVALLSGKTQATTTTTTTTGTTTELATDMNAGEQVSVLAASVLAVVVVFNN